MGRMYKAISWHAGTFWIGFFFHVHCQFIVLLYCKVVTSHDIVIQRSMCMHSSPGHMKLIISIFYQSYFTLPISSWQSPYPLITSNPARQGSKRRKIYIPRIVVPKIVFKMKINVGKKKLPSVKAEADLSIPSLNQCYAHMLIVKVLTDLFWTFIRREPKIERAIAKTNQGPPKWQMEMHRGGG